MTCFKGPVWITQNNDQRDVVLSAGQSFTLDRKGPAIVFALKDAAILVGPAGQVVPVRQTSSTWSACPAVSAWSSGPCCRRTSS